MPLETYPENPDSWGESLTPVEGYWDGNGEVSLDRINKRVGEACIRIYQETYMYYLTLIFSLHAGKEFDATRKNAKIHFWHGLPSGFTGICSLVLMDTADRMAVRDFGTPPTGEWQFKEFLLGSGTGWTEDPGFDWSHVKDFRVDCDQEYPGWGTQFWIDSPHFSYEVVMPTLRVESEPTGKHFEIDGTSGFTPATFQLTPNVAYIVNIDSTDFKQWENGDTTPTRTIVLSEGETLAITGYYEGAKPPPPPPPLGKGTLLCRAYADGDEISTTVKVIGIDEYSTPFYVYLDPGAYSVLATYNDQAKGRTAIITEAEITLVSFDFKRAGIDWLPLLALGGIGAIATVLLMKT